MRRRNMIKDEIEEAINEQVNAELYSSYLYLSMATYFGDEGLDGFEKWMHGQFIEEINHAMRLYDFLESRGGRVKLKKIEKPERNWNSPLDAFEDAYDHEQHVTDRINELADLAEEENDRATLQMLQWFIEEQVEEEETAEEIVEKLEMIGDDSSGLIMFDKELGNRPIESVFPIKPGEGGE